MRPLCISLSVLSVLLTLQAVAADRWTVGGANSWEADAVQTENLLASVPGQPLFYSGNTFRSLSDGSPVQYYPMQGSALAFSADWQLYVVGGHDLARIHDGPSGELKATLDCQDEPRSLGPDAVSCAAFSKDDRFLITGGFKQVKVWEWAANRLVGTIQLPHHAIATQVGVTADNEYLVIALKKPQATCCDYAGEIKIYRLSDLTEIRTEEVAYPPALAFSSKDSTIAFSSGTNGIRIWNVKEALEIGLVQHSGKVTAMSFCPDGSMLVSSGEDLTTRTWCTASGRELRSLTTSQIVNKLAYTADGGNLLIGENNSKVTLREVFTVTIQPLANGELKLNWDGGCGRYQVQSRELHQTGWTNLGETIETTELIVAASTSGRMFRVLNAP